MLAFCVPVRYNMLKSKLEQVLLLFAHPFASCYMTTQRFLLYKQSIMYVDVHTYLESIKRNS